MYVKQLDLTKQYKNLKPEIDKAILDVCESGQFILGKTVETFEKRVAEYLGTQYAIGVSSGSAALLLALKAIGIKPGDEVIVPANTYIATAFAVTHCGATPIFADCDEYYNIDSHIVNYLITQKTKAIIAVHLYGQPCNMKELIKVANKHNLFLVEDCAQAFGAEYDNKKVGTFGDIACFSFYPGKNLGAYGDGGLVVTSNARLDNNIRMLRNDGQVAKYQHEVCGFNERLDAIQAAILNVKLDYIDTWNERRADIADTYTKRIINSAYLKDRVQHPIVINNVKPVWHQYVIKLNTRDQIKEILLKNYSVETGIHYPVQCFRQPCYKDNNGLIREELTKDSATCTSYYATRDCLSLPMYPELRDEEIHYVIDSLENIYGKA